jgi:alkanesulfonate monooxygenase SsuD/methylene tetrahydromethanopterin reductase-like flavin-dependent oxidoreductase (luciferase family)
MSPDSVVAAVDLGARMVTFSQRPWPDQAAAFGEYRERFVERHRRDPFPPMTCDFVYCDTDAARAEQIAEKHIAGYLTHVLEHYELAGDHFKAAKGYESYGSAVDVLRAIGKDTLCQMYLDVQAWGTPQQILERLDARRGIIGDFDLTCCFRYSGLPFEAADRSMRTFANEVLPELKRW